MIKIIKKITSIFMLGIVSSCSLKGNLDVIPKGTAGIFPETTLDLSEEKQAKYKAEWMNNVKGITKGTYEGIADIWGGGALSIQFWFQDGDLWYLMNDYPLGNENLHPLIEVNAGVKKAMFVDGKTAIVYMPAWATSSPPLVNTLYILIVSNNSIYRTTSAEGFANLRKWDKLTIPSHPFMEIAKSKGFLLKESMITNGDPFIYETVSGATTIKYDTTSTSQSTFEKDIIKFTIGPNVIYWNTNISYTTPNTNLNTTIQLTESGDTIRINYTIFIENHKVSKISAITEPTKNLGMHIFSTLTPKELQAQFWVRPKGSSTNNFITGFRNSNVKKISESGNIITVQLTSGSTTNTFPLDTSVAFAREFPEGQGSPYEYNIEYTVGNTQMRIAVTKYTRQTLINNIYKLEK